MQSWGRFQQKVEEVFKNDCEEINLAKLLAHYEATKCRISDSDVFPKKCALENFEKLTRKHLCQSLFFNKEVLTQVFSCQFSEIFKNTFFTEHFRWLPLHLLDALIWKEPLETSILVD